MTASQASASSSLRTCRAIPWNSVVCCTSRDRGRQKGTSVIPATRPGRAVSDTTRSERKTASRDRVGHEHHGARALGPHPLQLEVERVAGQRVERGEGLVEEQHRRRTDQPACDRGPLAHADRELRRPAPFETADAGELTERRSTRRAARRARRPARGAAARRSPRRSSTAGGSAPGTRRRADRAPRRSGRPSNHTGRSSTVTRAVGRRRQPGHDPQQRRLATARRTDQRDDLVVVDREVDRFEREHRARSVAEPLPDAGEVDSRHQGAFAAVPAPRPIVIDTGPTTTTTSLRRADRSCRSSSGRCRPWRSSASRTG